MNRLASTVSRSRCAAGPTGWRDSTTLAGTTVTACGNLRLLKFCWLTATCGLLTMVVMLVMLVTCVTLTLRTYLGLTR